MDVHMWCIHLFRSFKCGHCPKTSRRPVKTLHLPASMHNAMRAARLRQPLASWMPMNCAM